MVMTDNIDIEIEELTPEQAAAIWKQQEKRPANFLSFVMYLQAKRIGEAFNITTIKSNDHAASIRKWFNVAGRERKRFDTVDGQTVETPEPVVVKWKESSHKENRQVEQDGKVGQVEVRIIDRLHGMVIAADDAPLRGRGANDDRELVDEIISSLPTADVAGKKTLTLPDGRTAQKTRSGHWRAPKLATDAAPTPDAPADLPTDQTPPPAPAANGTPENAPVAAGRKK